jgi:ABC-2 type transport system ATP-binding protein
MNTDLVTVQHLRHNFGPVQALEDVSFTVPSGRILGVLGPNGAGKTTLLRALLGLQTVKGDLQVLGQDPRHARHALMNEVAFIADVATLPRWLRVSEAIDFVAGVHPRFDRVRCEAVLARTHVPLRARIRTLSKGMIVQVHLALVLAIQARVLVLDEPTLGLDVLYRKTFYRTLLEDYCDETRTIIVSTHQMEEIEALLTDVLFLREGRVVLNTSVEALGDRFTQVRVPPSGWAAARALGPIDERAALGERWFVYDGVARAPLEALGEVTPVSLSDIFVATMTGARA